MPSLTLVITQECANIRIDKCVSEAFTDYSRSYLQKMIKDQQLLVNGKPIKAGYQSNEGDVVTMEVPDLVVPEIVAENIPLTILYEDTDVIVVDKPKGMVVHPDHTHHSGTLVNALMYHCKDLSGINGVMRPGIVHRIDMNTTGSIIACKNDYAHNQIAAQLKEHSINRRYIAIVHGVIKEDEGTIHAPIGRHKTNRKKMAINEQNGKDAITHYKVLKRFRNYTYIECQLETGRTHQIRVHMASIHHPLLGDDVYCSLKCPYPNLIGQTLHAKVLGFLQPTTGKYIEVIAKTPEYFENLLNILS